MDDLESVGYMLIDLLNGGLPWDQLKHIQARPTWKASGKYKLRVEVSSLCDGLPKGFESYMNYVRHTARGTSPDYQFLRSALR